MKNLSKKFSKNLFFSEIKMVSENEVQLNVILPALEKFSEKGDLDGQQHREQILKNRITKFLGFEPKFSINY